MDEAQEDRIWSKFCEDFAFRASVRREDWPSIREPVHSITWDISATLMLYESNQAAFEDSERTFKNILWEGLRATVTPGRVVYAMSWHHRSYMADPRKTSATETAGQWRILVLPVGNYKILISEDFTHGVFCHPWEQSMCVFGRPLLDFLQRTVGDPGPVLRRCTEAGVKVERGPTPIPPPHMCPACGADLQPWAEGMRQQTCPLCGDLVTR